MSSRGRMTFEVEMSDGTTHIVKVGDTDTIAAEAKFGMDATTWSSTPKTEHFAYLAWHALKRRKVVDMSWEEFRDDLEVVDPVLEDGETDPGNA